MVEKAKNIKQLKQLAERICGLLPKLNVSEIRMSKVVSYERQVEADWNTFRGIHNSLEQDEELKFLYKSTEEKYISICQLIKTFREAAMGQEKSFQIKDAEDEEKSPKTSEDQRNVSASAAIAVTDRKKRRFFKLIDGLEEKLNQLEVTLGTLSENALDVKKSVITRDYMNVKTLFDEMIDNPLNEDIEDEFLKIQNDYDAMTEKWAERMDELKEDNKVSNTKLEHVKIPHFSGDLNDWPAFHDLFQQLIDSKKSLSNVEKLCRLKSIVHGEAGRTIQHIKTTDANYEAAWTMLKNKYENRRLLFANLVDKLLDQPSVSSQGGSSIKQLLSTTTECLQALKAMGIPLKDADPFIARIVIRKIDRDGLFWYEQSIQKTKEIQSLDDVMKFLEQQYLSQQAIQNKKGSNPPAKAPVKYSNIFQTSELGCKYCAIAGHSIEDCKKFIALGLVARKNWVKTGKLCEICMNHQAYKKCFKYKKTCSKCGGKHHTLLHYAEFEKKKTEQQANHQQSANLVTRENTSVTLLATAQVKIRSGLGEPIVLRALIDQGSQRTSISEEAAQILQLPKQRMKTELIGLGNTVVGVSKATMKISIRPRFQSDAVHHANAIVLKNLASAQPDKSFKEDLEKWGNYCLADPNFNKSDRVDVVIGADLFNEIIQPGIVKLGKIVGQETTLGLILSGVLNLPASSNKVVMAVTRGIERFWEMEEIPADAATSEMDDGCENFFQTTTSLDENNRWVVKLPFKDDRDLGDSRKMAIARLLSLEKKLKLNTNLSAEYHKFMEDYLKDGHMEKLNQQNTGKYYMPHQAVIRNDHSTTKVRVVFDASAKSSNGRSLNDVLHTGPKLQYDIFEILIMWRLWQYVVTADVEKMFRQIKVAEDDQSHQIILWRTNVKKPIDEYKLKTVTYGTACAPFLAKRVLLEIANDCKDTNPKLHTIIKNNFYMDDLMTGADTKEDCMKIQVEISNQLQKFGLMLRKWLSNEKGVLSQITDVSNNKIVKIEEGEAVKTLGVQWEPETDNFTFYFKLPEYTVLTKRLALSTLAKIFDPLGWLAPITTLAKLYIQKLWLMDLEWDVTLSEELSEEWRNILKNLAIIGNVKIPRWLNTMLGYEWELHGFADASGKAYAAVIYAKVGSTVTLIAAKSKVNPIKNRKTLPKLELCAAHLLAKLINKIVILIQRNIKIYAWGDSTIALAWVKNEEKTKDKFIRTRVNEIKELIPTAKWNHIRSKDNPADPASRGMIPDKLIENSLWWNGPTWLKEDEEKWPKQTITTTLIAATTINQSPNFLDELVTKISSYNKIIRVVAYVLRFIKKLKGNQCPTYLSTDELNDARTILIRNVQRKLFPEEISCLKNRKEIPTRNKICSLNPFLDENDILRVGGRLANARLNYNRKHPILLAKCAFTDLMVNWVHATTLHGGVKVMEAVVRRTFWVIGGKNSIKKRIQICVKCQRYRQKTMKQIMGNLPENRITVSPPFTHSGVDYAGPIQMRVSRGRGQKAYKGYIAVFVCLTTKAVHLEAVSELSTEAFMAALRRFFARRGKSAHIYSDNGTNFVGAARKIEKEYADALKANSSAAEKLADENIKWHFIPPGAPHFGGIWEAAVKSVKHHLRRVVGEAKLTFEEMSTLLSQVEGVLNSRPLCELPDNTEDIEVLTPGHFLIGRPLLDLPEGDGDLERISSLNRWKLLQKMKRDFWKQWKDEYLSTLQQRRKWKHSFPDIKVDEVVLIKDENTSPARWPLGRVVQTHPGADGKIRVVTIKVQQGVLKRPITKICPLEPPRNSDVGQQQYTSCYTRAKTDDFSISKIMLVMVMLMFGSAMSSNAATGTKIATFNEQTAIYLDNLGTVDVSTSNWNLVVYYNLNAYIESLEQVVNLTDKSSAVCGKIGEFEEQCKSTLARMQKRIAAVDNSNQLFSLNQIRRQKRGINFIGSFYHLLFGLMDDDDREELEHNMRSLLENQYNLKDLIKKQTSVVDSTTNLLTKSTNEANSRFRILQERIDNITLMVQEKMFIYKESIKFFAIARQIEAQLEEVEKTQSQIIRLLMDINHGKVSPDLLKPDQLSEEMTKIKEWLPETLRLPGVKENQLQTGLKLMKANAIILENKLVIKANLPLISSRTSNIFKVIPIPIQQANILVMASIPKPFLIYSYDGDVYHIMSDMAFHQCNEIGERHYLCEGHWAWQDANNNLCEVAPLKPHTDVKCRYVEVNNEHAWINLSNKQQWLFKTMANATLHVFCDKKRQDLIQLPKQGIISLGSGCSGRVGKTILPSSAERNDTAEGSFGTYLTNEINYKETKLIKPLGSMLIDHSAEIDALKEEIKVLKATDIHLKGLNFHHASGHMSLIIISIFILVLAIYFIKKCILQNRAGMIIVRRPQNVQM